MYDHVCGVKPLWNNYLVEQGIEPNSILAGYTVYQYYLDKTNSKTKALKEFKGIESKKKLWVIRKIQRVTNEVKDKYLKD